MFLSKFLSITALVAATVSAQNATHNVTLRYMPLGDSITEATCWRAKLWHKLQGTEWATTNFVGSKHDDNGCGDNVYDKDSEGHSGYLAINIAAQKQLDGWLLQNPADVITMHLGTNDVAYEHKVADIITAFTSLIASMRKANAKMKIVVAQILPMMKDHASQDVNAQALNTAIVPWAKGLNTTQSPIWVVDQHSNITAADMRDGLHPNDSGDTKMANVWYPALLLALAAAKADQ